MITSVMEVVGSYLPGVLGEIAVESYGRYDEADSEDESKR